ncbi:MAG: lectin like domain-containing protein [Syntrophomonas sp.]|uniref:lectin like domain-containing protein n=1 Tax=Syntrophomonas sp. TaxID=2053627 RepID=UPI002607E2F5|nr:lectin like domain-containing protein [Syntrophomonas sp.]MDD2509966.1 lectin like domain-containing protein [Syntrophomonas sp.]MDD3878767.1 lectin like domain-containing protein [Syntrophomonas sp.]MDD4626667.1 lectin like domain-containing protein [Syntrophomonas sp.]
MKKRRRIKLLKARLAKRNPLFEQYRKAVSASSSVKALTEQYRPGFIPHPLNLSHLKGLKIFPETRLLHLSSSYDLRKQGRLTPVKDQGPAGTCWAFATYGSLESCLLPEQEFDFSENNMKKLLSENCPTGYDRAPRDGGNQFMSVAYLTRWDGPVLEKEDPYDPFDNGSCSQFSPQKHIQNVIFIPDRKDAADNQNLKQAISKYGAVFSAMYYEEQYYNPDKFSYYFPSYSFSNHAICLVGWDDNYERKNFNIEPSKNGAFIARNSWGNAWGDNGYFYISYYDTNIGSDNALYYNAESPAKYNILYHYDPLGWIASVGYRSSTAWFANIFTASSNKQELVAVGWYIGGASASYQAMVYTDPVANNPRSGKIVKNVSGTITYPGYFTRSFSKPLALKAGQKFSIVVKLSTPGYNFPIPLEMPVDGYTSKAVAKKGQSFMSKSGTSWEDISNSWENSNVCLKAYALSKNSADDSPGKK